MRNFDWTCPFCGRDATLTGESTHSNTTYFTNGNAAGPKGFESYFVVCPNPKCKQYTLTVGLFDAEYNRTYAAWQCKQLLQTWNLIPASKAKGLPSYIPQSIRDDYNEACLILTSSPKASATLSRRCLQGMIRDFWGVKCPTLKAEIDSIQPKLDPVVWQAIEAVRKVGNIGAHMEKDINVIIDVEPKEAELLIGLIEFLIKDWYVSRENKNQHLKELIGVAEKKEAAKKAAPAN